MLKDSVSYRYPLLLLAILGLMAGLWSGVQRMGWPLPVVQSELASAHGPLMVCGFLGTLISLERAVALDHFWGYLAPGSTAAGTVFLVAGLYPLLGAGLITLGSFLLVGIFGVFLRGRVERFAQVMALGALAWAAANLVWMTGAPLYRLVYGWMGFLVLTIAGERLELSRMLFHSRTVQRYFAGALGIFIAGLLLTSVYFDLGVRVLGVGLTGISMWLGRYDIARRTVTKTGLTRFIAACLLTGYLWMTAAGLLLAVYGGQMGGLVYDAALHALFVGFVMAMIFGHAPIIFPSVLKLPISYHPIFYSHLALLHLSLLMRLIGDMAVLPGVRRWGGLLNAASILLFLANTAYSVVIVRGRER